MRRPSDAPTAVTSRRARNKERARERVYTSAKTLFGRKGYADTSVAEIAEHADIARGTFFNYFPRKDALISVWAEERRTELMRRLSPQLRRGSGVVADLRACLAVLGALNEEEPELSVAMLTAWVQAGRPLEEESYLGAIFADIVEAGRTRGEVPAAADAERVGELVRDLYLGTLYRWSRKDPADRRRHSLGAELQQALDLLLHGIAAPPGPNPPR